MTTLYLCEKPSQARDIAKVLNVNQRQQGFIQGSNIIVTWCLGHLLEQQPPEYYCKNLKPWRLDVLPVIPDTWCMAVKPKLKKQFNTVKALLKKATTVIIATDADREGECIAREVLDYCHYFGEIKRLWLSALDEASIQQALTQLKPQAETAPLYQAALARQRADWLIGMNMTMAASALFSKRGEGALSVGRVQTPTLNLVVKRDHHIAYFTPIAHYQLDATFNLNDNDTATTHWQIPKEMANEQGYCLDKEKVIQIKNIIQNQSGIIQEYNETPKKTPPPLCLSLSALQKVMSAQHGLSAKETLQAAQSLYETHKLTSYPRTDCGYLPASQHAEARTISEQLVKMDNNLASLIKICDFTRKSRVWNDKKITAHHAIIPTKHTTDLAKLNPQERLTYNTIVRYYLAQFAGDHEYQQRQLIINCQGHQFKAQANQDIQTGWKSILENKKIENTTTILEAQEGQTAQHQHSIVKDKHTQPPAHYTEGTLIDAMKHIARDIKDPDLKKILTTTAGIGTEATRANILETLFHRQYLKRQGKQVMATDKGKALIEKLPDSLTNPITTAQWEQQLEEIAQGGKDKGDFLQEQSIQLRGTLKALE